MPAHQLNPSLIEGNKTADTVEDGDNSDALSDRSDSSRVATYTLRDGITGAVLAVDRSRNPFKYGVPEHSLTWGYVPNNNAGLRIYNTTPWAKVHVSMSATGFPSLELNAEEFEFLAKRAMHAHEKNPEERIQILRSMPESLRRRFKPTCCQEDDCQSSVARNVQALPWVRSCVNTPNNESSRRARSI
eukprot:Gregarina_sp_Poly_1__7731@NODE_436_length_8449_cov_138_152470_g356_i0_p5_GENE_NODE_436_length_8449_cov_138_152470_g356_i0NODE_436_length_8449_cov_138_152470_g356_i0_p5_ORF_typecomplete_len188_score19_10_NODE_436_length_8449_cov_138_152470_g356_i024933056